MPLLYFEQIQLVQFLSLSKKSIWKRKIKNKISKGEKIKRLKYLISEFAKVYLKSFP